VLLLNGFNFVSKVSDKLNKEGNSVVIKTESPRKFKNVVRLEIFVAGEESDSEVLFLALFNVED